MTICSAVAELLDIVDKLRIAYPKKKFALDGRLVIDIGEVLAEGAYDLTLFEDVRKHLDARAKDGRLVQIKATMKKSLTFPADLFPSSSSESRSTLTGVSPRCSTAPAALRGRR
jgi:hypothetical protein